VSDPKIFDPEKLRKMADYDLALEHGKSHPDPRISALARNFVNAVHWFVRGNANPVPPWAGVENDFPERNSTIQ
jgi:hypothetical protein